jgi:hypothetical protein
MDTQTWNDAGLLREYIANKFAHQFEVGFHQTGFSRALRLCNRVAQLTGGNRDEIFDQIAAEAQ